MSENTESVKERGLLTVTPSPHIRGNTTTRSVMADVLLALTPAAAWGVFVFGVRVITVIAVSMLSSVLFEFLYQKLMKKRVAIGDLSAAVTGLLLGLNMPATIPLWIPVVGSAFAIILCKQLFGGLGKNFVNPAMAARVFLFTCWPVDMNTYSKPFVRLGLFSTVTADATASATPLADMTVAEGTPLIDLFFGNTAGCIGEVSALLLLVGGVYLLIRRTISWHTPVAFIATVAVICALFHPSTTTDILDYLVRNILSGGVMLGAIYMATDYVTAPVTPVGKVIYGVGCGTITMFIRAFGSYPEGVSFGILIMNLLVWYIDRFTRPAVFGVTKQRKQVSK